MDRARTEFMEFREAYRKFRSPARTIRACRANGLTPPSFACVALAPVSVWFFRMVFTCAREATNRDAGLRELKNDHGRTLAEIRGRVMTLPPRVMTNALIYGHFTSEISG